MSREANLTICPICHCDDFSHIEDCPVAHSSDDFPGYLKQLGDLRIAGPAIEVEQFLYWLKDQGCAIVGWEEVPAVRNMKAVDISLNILFRPGIRHL